jgi:hypothetical protein
MLAVMLFTLAIPLSAWYADRVDAHRVLAETQVVIIGFVAMGFVYGPLGRAMDRLFPISVRQAGTTLARQVLALR